MAFFQSGYPTAEPGYINDSGSLEVNGQAFDGPPQIQPGKRRAGNAVAIKVGRGRAILGYGGLYAARTTQPPPEEP